MINSRAKGARAERNLANTFKEAGFPARRGQQFSGGPDSPDVILEPPFDWFHVEAKWVEALRLNAARDQSMRDCGPRIPTVCDRRNNVPWWIQMPLDDWCVILRYCDPDALRKYYLDQPIQ